MCKWCNPKYEGPSEAVQRANIGWAEDLRGDHMPPVGPVVAKRAPRRKNTKRWCRGKEGREHVVVVARDSYFSDENRWKCGMVRSWKNRDEWVWRCFHILRCENCGKILERGDGYLGQGEKCPDFHTVEAV